MAGKDAAASSALALPIEPTNDQLPQRTKGGSAHTDQAPATDGSVLYMWMTRKEICDHLGVPPHTLYRMVRRGEVDCNRNGERLRYRPVAVDLDLADLEARAEEAAERERGAALHRSRYLDALVALVDGLTERLVNAEKQQARATQSRDDALDAARKSSNEASLLVRQLNTYCQALVESSSALQEANGIVRLLRNQLSDLRGELLEVAASPLALPVRSRLFGMAERAQ